MRFLLAVFLCAIPGCATAFGADRNSAYFLDGLDRRDGMSARIMPDLGRTAVAGDMLALFDCASAKYPVCFSSEYMVFAYPSDVRTAWTAGTAVFRRVGKRTVFDMGLNEPVEMIASSQKKRRLHLLLQPQLRSGGLGSRLSFCGRQSAA